MTIHASFPPGYKHPRRCPLNGKGWFVLIGVLGGFMLLLRLIGR